MEMEMESIEYKSEKRMVLFVFLWLMITKLLTAVTKIKQMTMMWMIVMKTRDLDPRVDFVKEEFFENLGYVTQECYWSILFDRLFVSLFENRCYMSSFPL